MRLVRALILLAVLAQCTWARGGRGGRGGVQHNTAPDIDPYEVLGLAKDATPKQIKSAYRKLSLKYHPDKNKSKGAKEKMREVAAAFEMIGDPDKKTIFDEFGSGEKFYSRWHYQQSQAMKGKQMSKKGFYAQSDDVKTLTVRSFYSAIKKGGIMVEFYAPWCVHCQEMVGEYKKAGILLEGVAKLGAVNCEAEQQLCNQQGIRGYPSLRFYLPSEGGKKPEVEEYNGEHQADALYGWIQQTLSSDLKKLGSDDFMQSVNNGKLWVVDFSAGEWCGPCTGLKSFMRRAAANLAGVAELAIVNCDMAQDVCSRMNVQYFPQIRLFQKGKTGEEGELLEMQGHFPAAGVLDLLQTILKILHDPPEEQAPAIDGLEDVVLDSELDDEDSSGHDEL